MAVGARGRDGTDAGSDGTHEVVIGDPQPDRGRRLAEVQIDPGATGEHEREWTRPPAGGDRHHRRVIGVAASERACSVDAQSTARGTPSVRSLIANSLAMAEGWLGSATRP